MKKALIFAALLVLLQVSSAFALQSEDSRQLANVFKEVVKVGDAAAADDWSAAQQKIAEIKLLLLDIAPSVQQTIGEHAYRVIDGFVAQLQRALEERDRTATAGSLISLQKMNGWLAAQYPAGI